MVSSMLIFECAVHFTVTSIADFEVLLGELQSNLSPSANVLASHLRRDFLRILEHLRAMHMPKESAQVLIQFWETLGRIAGLSEGTLLAERNRELKDASGGLVGCSWNRCPLFEQECASATLLCAGCQKAMYCGTDCQER